MKHSKTLPLLAIAALLCFASAVHADTITMTTGTTSDLSVFVPTSVTTNSGAREFSAFLPTSTSDTLLSALLPDLNGGLLGGFSDIFAFGGTTTCSHNLLGCLHMTDFTIQLADSSDVGGNPTPNADPGDDASDVTEPSTLTMLAGGLLLLSTVIRKRTFI